jgi:subtilisin
MRQLALTIIVPLLFLACGREPASPSTARGPGFSLQNQKQARFIPDHYIVVFTDAVTDPPGTARALAVTHGLQLRHTYAHALKGFAAVVPPGRVAALRADPRVRYVTPDRLDELHQQQGLPTGIDRIDADLNTAATASDPVNVDIAFLDTGVDSDNPDLNVYRMVSFAGGRGEDGYGHGTHVAGTAAAKDNGAGVVGVAPGARIWAVKVCRNNGSCSRSDIIAGIDYVAQHADEIAVANMSLGGSGSDDGACGYANDDPEHQAICAAVNKGVVFVVSAGNSYADASNTVPASYDEAITVSALADFDGKPGGQGTATCRSDEDDSFAGFSNFGADVDLMAPGVCIESTWNDGGYNTISGTSMAAPHVTGTVALYIANNQRATDASGVSLIKTALVQSGIAQVDACGLSTFDDPDGNAEPIVFANAANVGGDGSCAAPSPVVGDIAIASVSAEPASAAPGQAIDITVTVDNLGVDVASDIHVRVVSDNATPQTDDDLLVGETTLVGGLPAGAETAVVFSWNTLGANDGEHTLTASHALNDADGTNNTETAIVTLAGPATPTLHVDTLERASTRNGGGTWTAWVRITVQDADGVSLSGAKVTGIWSDGATGESACDTDASGMCEVSYGPIANSWGNVRFTVSDVRLDGFAYDEAESQTTERVFAKNSDDYKK